MSKRPNQNPLPPSSNFDGYVAFCWYHLEDLLGQVLTTTETIGLQKTQEDAVKSIIRRMFSTWFQSIETTLTHEEVKEVTNRLYKTKGWPLID